MLGQQQDNAGAISGYSGQPGEPPAPIRITHRNIDGHTLSPIQLALLLGLPIGQGDDIVGHAMHMVTVLKSNKLID